VLGAGGPASPIHGDARGCIDGAHDIVRSDDDGDSARKWRGVAQVWVPAGTFLMGTDETDPTGDLAPPDWARFELASERPQHEVSLSSGYWIDTTEVTNAAYQAFVDAGGYQDRKLWSSAGWTWLGGRDATALPAACVDAVPDQPRVCITARGASSSIFPWGDDWDATKANVVDSRALTAVGAYPDGASWVGAGDMAGNAMEWVADWYSPSFASGDVRNPKGPESGPGRGIRGGGWQEPADRLRSAKRFFAAPDNRANDLGFRCARDATR